MTLEEVNITLDKREERTYIIKGIERDKLIIQYARKPGLAHNQRWKYQDGYIFPSAAPHLVIDIKVKHILDSIKMLNNSSRAESIRMAITYS